MIEELGLTPLRLVETGGNGSSKSSSKPSSSSNGSAKASTGLNFKLGSSKKVPFAALEDFTRSLSSLLTAGVPLSRALTILYKECPNPAAAAKWRELHDFVIDGMPLAKAMERAPDVFRASMWPWWRPAEAGGFLDVVLAQIADFQVREKEMRAKVMAALMYPAVLLTLATGVVVFLMVFFIPRFKDALRQLQRDAAAHHAGDRRRGRCDPALRPVHCRRSFRLDLVHALTPREPKEPPLARKPPAARSLGGPARRPVCHARFCRMLGTLTKSAVPLISGLEVARRSLGYQTLIDYVTESIERVKKGETLATSLSSCRSIFPGSSLEMLAVAQESGRLEDELLRLATVTESTLDRQLKTVIALTEPIMLFVIAAVVGTIFIGMLLPVFTLTDHLK